MSQPTSVPKLLLHHAVESRDKVAFSGPGWAITYGDLEKRTKRISAHLVRAGIGRGDFVAIVLGRCLEAVESVLAITRSGAVGVPLDPRSPSSDLAKVLDHSGARAIITDDRHLATVCAAAGKECTIIISTPNPSVDVIEGGFSAVRYQDWAEDEEVVTSDVTLDDLGEHEEAFLHYTSGTTSLAKGVLSSQKSILWNANNVASVFGLSSKDRFFWPLPLFHILGHSLCIMATVILGASAHLSDPDQTLLDNLLVKEVEDATIIVGAPATFHELAEARTEALSPLSLPRLRVCMSAGAAAPVPLCNQVQELFGVLLQNNYGCTETCGAIGVSRPGDVSHQHGSVMPLPDWEIKLMDQDGNQVKDGEQGEVWVRGPGLMLRYYKEAQSPFTADGWFPTGDTGILSTAATGRELSLVGRKKELIIRGGENIQPAEIEQVLLQYPGVADVVVAAAQHKLLGETPAAFIVKNAPDLDLDLSALLAACRQALPDYKVPTAFYEIDAVPRTLLGKPRRLAVASLTSKPLTVRFNLNSKDSVEALVLAETAGACGVQAGPGESELDPDWLRRHFDQAFVFLGLTSMAGVVLRDRLASLTGLNNLPNTLVFDYSTPAAVSEYLYSRLTELETPPSPKAAPTGTEAEPIAIIAMACRYPGGISSPDDLWQLVSDEVDATSDFPDDRGWNVDSLYSTDPTEPFTSTTKRGGFLRDFADFDAGLFGMAPREALATDPQQRLLLETTWELAERGGIAPLSLKGTQTSCFIGTLYDDYEANGFGNAGNVSRSCIPNWKLILDLARLAAWSPGAFLIALKTHFETVGDNTNQSLLQGLHGPSLTISTGCSSSLCAIHAGAQSLRNGECTLSIAGGVTTMASPRPFTMFSKRRGLSADGRCRTYSSDAAGTGWSEGVGLIMLEKLSDAKRNGRRILGVIRGSAVNSDGTSNGLTAPSGPAQQMCIQSALAQAALSPADVDVLEGHGTATPLGDPIEVQAVINAYGNGVNGAHRANPLLLGSIKSNIGHTQAAAAVAGIIKMVQSIRHGVAPTSLHIREPSKHINWEGCGVELLDKARQWPLVDRPRRAAVSSFGIGGTNAKLANSEVQHIILEQPETAEQDDLLASRDRNIAYPWILSGADQNALHAQAEALLAAWRGDLGKEGPADIAFSLATARSALKYRAVVTYALGPNLNDQIESALTALAQDEPHPDTVTGNINTTGNKPRLACLFSGQGSRMPDMAALEELRAAFPVFSQAFQAACYEVNQHLEHPVEHAIGDSSLLERTDFSQATLFVFEVAMYRLLESCNVRPDVVSGHSLGEIAAAHISGALSLRDAAIIVTARSKLMAALDPNGGMAAISATEEEVAEELLRSGSTATIAAVNSQKSVVVSGTQEAIKAVADKFADLGRRTTVLRNVRHGFHSPMMNSILPDLEDTLASSLEGGKASKIPLVSTVTGKRADAAQLSSPKHWASHVSEPVRFADSVNELLSAERVSVFVEVGPSAVLSPHVPGTIATHGTVGKLLNTLGQLWSRGVPVDWQAVYGSTGARLVDLPVYAFQRRKFWLPYRTLLPAESIGPVAAQPQAQGVGASTLDHGVLLNATSIPGINNIVCSGLLSTTRQPWLSDHVISGQSLVPATVFAELALRAGHECAESSDSEQMILDELVLMAPLALSSAEEDDEQEVQIQVVIGEPQDEGGQTGRSIDVYSRPSGVATQHEWTQHATGTLQLAPRPGSENESLTNGTYTTEVDSDVDVATAYAALDDVGISYGLIFQGVRAIWRKVDNELLVQIEPPQNQGQKSGFILHPALLDAALHAPILAAPEKVSSGQIRLPFSLQGIQVFAAATSASGPLLARIRDLGEERLSVTITDKSTGALVAEVSEVKLRVFQPAVAEGDLYRLKWTELKSAPAKRSSVSDEIVVVPGSHNIDAAEVPKAVHNAVTETLRAVQEWRAKKAQSSVSSRLVFVTEEASSIPDADVVTGAVWGFVRSAQAEFGAENIILINLDGSAESQEALSAALAAGEEVVSVQGGKVMVPTLSKDSLVPSTSTSTTLDVSGTVLITGGTGGLGVILSRYLVRNHGAENLLIVSRSGIEAPGAQDLLDELSGQNEAVVRIEACDISESDQLAALLERNNGHPPITAIVHCAGVVDDGVLSSQTAERVSRVLRPKVEAAWNLHQLAPDTVRSFVLYSSFVGVIGNEGQAAYAAGNAFLNALARLRVSQGLPAVSLAWGPWANDVGMAAGNKLAVPNLRVANAQPFVDQQGLQLFDRALQASEPVLVPLLLRGPFPMVPATGTKSKAGKASAKGGAKTGAVWRRKLAAVSPEDRDDTLLGLVRDEIAAVLGYQGDDMLPDKPLTDLGFDSFTSVTVSNRMRVLTGFRDLPVTLALDYDSPQALVKYLSDRFKAEPDPEVDLDSYIPDEETASGVNGSEQGPTAQNGHSNGLSNGSSGTVDGPDNINPEEFRGLAKLHRRLCRLEQYTAAADLLASAALAMPTFPKDGLSLSSYIADPQRLATGPSGSDAPLPLVFIAPFFPRIKIGGVGLSVYSAVASALNGQRDVFELPHPDGQVIPEDLDTLAELHATTIREQFADRSGIILAGYSAGGTIAYAVASKLAQGGAGPRLAGFVLVDTYLTMTGRGDPDWLNALPAEALVSRLGGPSVGGPEAMGGESLVGDLDLALTKVGGYFRTLRDWDQNLYPLPDALSTLFVRALDPSDKMPKDADIWRPKWQRANFTVEVPGSHLALLDKRYAPAIAVEIQQWAKEHLAD
ncbi:beta-ketoacyl synthase domain-containing protein [Seiridium cupressi]